MDTVTGKTLGDYYRDLSANYYYYSLNISEPDHPNALPWPTRPACWVDPLGGAELDDYPGF